MPNVTLHLKMKQLSYFKVRCTRHLLLNIFACTLMLPIFAQETSNKKMWSFELHGGIVYNYPLPLVFRQSGQPDIRIQKALFYSEPLNDPFYWDWRFSRWRKNKAFEFEAIHHKIYLLNKPSEVQHFGISHGFNILSFNRAWQKKHYILRVGAGSILVHAESTVRGKEYYVGPGFNLKGYRVRGALINLAIAKRLNFNDYFFTNIEAKITGAILNADIVDGKARVHSLVFHLILGPGVNWNVRPITK